MKKRIIIFLIFLLLFFLVSSLIVIDGDEVNCFGFSYNIARGLIPYKDFNMVMGPLYSLIMTPLIKLIGNYYIVFKLEHCVIYSLIFTFIYEKFNIKTLFIFFIFCARDTLFGYNSFVLILFLAILLLHDSKVKSKNIIIGILIGIIIMTKQNIGFCLLIVYLLINRHKIKECFSVFISVIPVIIYLIINNTVKEYIDFCYLGLGSFFDNLYIDLNSIVGYLIFFVPFVYMILKRKKNDPEILYILAFQSISIPIFDEQHIFAGAVPIVYYILLKNNNYIIDYYIKSFTTVFFVIFIGVSLKGSKLMIENNFLKYQLVNKNVPNYLKKYSNYIDNNSNYRIYLFMENAYLLKIYRNEPIDFYDMIDKGNMGSNEKYYVEKMEKDCSNKKCMFILDSYFYNDKYYQGMEIFKDSVEKNNEFLEVLPSGDKVYINKK